MKSIVLCFAIGFKARWISFPMPVSRLRSA